MGKTSLRVAVIDDSRPSLAPVKAAIEDGRLCKPAWPIDEAYRQIVKGRGARFDPVCVDVFRFVRPDIVKIMSAAPAVSSATSATNAESLLSRLQRRRPTPELAVERVA